MRRYSSERPPPGRDLGQFHPVPLGGQPVESQTDDRSLIGRLAPRSAGTYGIKPWRNACSWISLDRCRASTNSPLTWIIQAIGFLANMSGTFHSGSNWRILRSFRIAAALADPVASDTPNPRSISVMIMWCGWLGSPKKFTDPIDAHDPAGPRLGLAPDQRRGPLPGQDVRELAAELAVIVVQVLPAEGVGQGHDPVMRRFADDPALGSPRGPRAPVGRRVVADFVRAGRAFSGSGGSEVMMPDRSLAAR